MIGQKIAIIGGGNLGRAIAEGLLSGKGIARYRGKYATSLGTSPEIMFGRKRRVIGIPITGPRALNSVPNITVSVIWKSMLSINIPNPATKLTTDGATPNIKYNIK